MITERKTFRDTLRETDTQTLRILERALDRDARRAQSNLALLRRELKRRKKALNELLGRTARRTNMATPSKLKPGAMVRLKSDANAPIFIFVARHGSKYCRCQCDRYKGLDGPDDPGFVDVSDWDMARKYERVFVRPNTGGKPRE